jgi:hypothetical protein
MGPITVQEFFLACRDRWIRNLPGPRKTLAENKLVAVPRFSTDHISAMTPNYNNQGFVSHGEYDNYLPPALTRGATAKNPPRNRVINRVSMFLARA